MRRTALIAVIVLAALTTATASSAAAVLTHTGAHVYSRTIPQPCFAHAPAGHPRRLALGCVCPVGEVVAHRPTATYRFALRVGTPFLFEVAWGGQHKPKVTTSQAGPWSYVKVHGPRRCAIVTQVFRVTVVPR
jgi:hypothetical protein